MLAGDAGFQLVSWGFRQTASSGALLLAHAEPLRVVPRMLVIARQLVLAFHAADNAVHSEACAVVQLWQAYHCLLIDTPLPSAGCRLSVPFSSCCQECQVFVPGLFAMYC